MHHKLKNKLHKAVALLLTLVTAFTMLPDTALAASERALISFDYCYDSSGNLIRYDNTITHGGLTVGTAGNARTYIMANGETAFCIQPGYPLRTGDSLTLNASTAWNALSNNQRNAIKAIILYGLPGNSSNLPGSFGEQWIATQTIIWEITTGGRNATGNYAVTDRKFINATSHSGVHATYNAIDNLLKTHNTIPSFMNTNSGSASVSPLTWDGTKYTTTLEDSNSILSAFHFSSSNSDVTISRSGNKLSISTNKDAQGDITITATKNIPTVSASTQLLAYGHTTQQDIVTGIENVSGITAYLKVNIPYGHINLVKDSEDGVVSGIKFHVKGENIDTPVTTGNDGSIKIENLRPGTYTITEINEDRYVPQESKQVTVNGGETAKVTFSNVLKRGDLKVTKNSEDGLVEGMKFRLSGTALSGAKVDVVATTNASGVAEFKNILISGSQPYILEEVDTAIRYVVPQKQNATINWNEVTQSQMTNTLKKFRVNAEKIDSETGKAQADATLDGARYGIYKGEKLIDTYTTAGGGKFITKYYICDDDWYIQEIAPSTGYLLDTTKYPVGAEAKNFTVELNTLNRTYKEDIIKGRVAIIKHTDEANPATGNNQQIEKPEKDAKFEIYLSSSGSYDKAVKTERDILVTDENGYALSKLLPYGTYTVHQVSGLEGKNFVPDFQVFIHENEKTYPFIINNTTMKSLIEIVKKDKETGKIIPIAGIGFQVYDAKDKLITQRINYPTPVDLDTFYTDATGKLMLPSELEYGKYKLVEVQTCYGYVLDSTPVDFVVDGTKKTVTVEKHNMAQKGKISLVKYGDTFSTVILNKDHSLPVFSETLLNNAKFDIIAATDIVTGDGTVRAKKGTVVDTLTTKDGMATSKELYLGDYLLIETAVPDGFVLDATEHLVSLTYAGQEVSVTDTEIQVQNTRQKVSISLKKTWEKDDIFSLGDAGEYKNIIFGLFAAEDLKAADETFIPSGALIELINVDENGNGLFKTELPFGKYYVKEYSTDNHYVLSSKTYPVNFTYAGPETKVVEIVVNKGDAIDNKLIRGSVSGLKTDDNGVGLEGAQIGLFYPNSDEYTEDTALLITESGENGVFEFENIPFGHWIIAEIVQPEGYILNEGTYPVTILSDKQVVEITIENILIQGIVQVLKFDAEYPDNNLSGAEFEVYIDDGDKEFDPDNDLLVAPLVEISEGTYQLEELIKSGYFLLETKAPDGFILDETPYYFEIIEHQKIVNVETEAGKGFLNTPETGIIEITKRDISTGALIPDCGIEILDEDKNVIIQDRTDENGIVRFTLRPGKYYYREFDAPVGYLLDETPHPFEIKENGEIIKAEMTNEKIPTDTPRTSDSPKTGDTNNLLLYCALIAASLGVCIYLYFRKKKASSDTSEPID